MLDFNNLKNKKVVVMGLGLFGGGVETVKWLIKQGALVLVTDLKTKKELKGSLNKLKSCKIKYVLGKHRKKDFQKADLIIKNPGVSRDSKFLKIARDHGIPIESDLSLFFRLFKGKIIGVTGTKGKSTTISLLAHILKTAKKKFILGGNIGQSPLNYLNKNYPLALLEISSWQLEDLAHLKKSPQIACIITIFPDHLDSYNNFNDYVKAKKLIFKFQTKNDFLILNADNQIVKKFAEEAKSRVIFFSSKEVLHKFIPQNLVLVKQNIAAASKIALLLKISTSSIKRAIRSFRGVPNRLEFVRQKCGVKYINDSASTVPQSTILAINNLSNKKNIILISGGADKKLDFSDMIQEISKKCKIVILLPGTATFKIKNKILKTKNHPPFFLVNNMNQAVRLAASQAQRNDIVLLSPGCASFGIFQNAYDRAKQFIKEVKSL